MKTKYLLLLLITNLSFSQDGQIYETYRTRGSNATNESHQTIFQKPFQEFNYIKTQRGIEVYETYKTKEGNGTNESHGTLFSKPFPTYIIINNKMYRTYKTDSNTTNKSHGTIFAKPFESKVIANQNDNEGKKTISETIYKSTYREPLPSYNGSGDITYGE